jgi:hypothetical protein
VEAILRAAAKENAATIAISSYYFRQTGAGTDWDLGNSDKIWGKHGKQLCAGT